MQCEGHYDRQKGFLCDVNTDTPGSVMRHILLHKNNLA
jgi:hypothetical protein